MSADVREDSIIEFGVHWIESTSRAVYEEREREEINSGQLGEHRETFIQVFN